MNIRSLLHLPAALRDSLLEMVYDNKLRQNLLEQNDGLSIRRGVEIRSPKLLVLGKGVIIDSYVLLHCGGMDWSSGKGGIRIGDYSYIGPHSVLFGAGGITIGSQVLISPGVIIASHEHTFALDGLSMREQPHEFSPVLIEDNVYIGANATILPGVTIETGTVIGAGAVVTKNLPARSLCLGVPAKMVRAL